MLHIILLIFKIIGTILLVIIGLLLFILLTVLLVPIRYKVAAEHGEAFRMEGRVSWFLHLLNAKVTHIEGKLHIRVRVLWFQLYDNLRPRQSKLKSNKKRKSKKHSKSRADIKKQKQGTIKSEQIKKSSNEVIGKSKEDVIRNEEIVRNRIEDLESDDNRNIIAKETPSEDRVYIHREVDASKSKQTSDKDKKTLFHKIRMKIKRIKDKIVAFFIGIKNKLAKWFEKAMDIKHKVNLISDFIKNEWNREGFKITYASLKKLLKHILPRKLKSRVIFGTGDPCSTGQVLGAMSILYSFYGDKVQITPDFANKRFEGKHFARGRIRLGTLLIIGIKLIRDKRFKQLKTNLQILKEAL